MVLSLLEEDLLFGSLFSISWTFLLIAAASVQCCTMKRVEHRFDSVKYDRQFGKAILRAMGSYVQTLQLIFTRKSVYKFSHNYVITH